MAGLGDLRAPLLMNVIHQSGLGIRDSGLGSAVILSRFAPLRIALSGAKGLTVNSAKNLGSLFLRHPGSGGVLSTTPALRIAAG